MFYINYEECKYILLLAVLSYQLSFILTMRNVNLWGLVGLVIALIRFILTMRNVNLKAE